LSNSNDPNLGKRAPLPHYCRNPTPQKPRVRRAASKQKTTGGGLWQRERKKRLG